MSATVSQEPDYKYWAFISYNHQDNLATRGDGSGDHIAWANWLHEQLETFVIPEGYRDRTARTGEPMPERFFPTFRDEAELPTSHDLGGQIRDALAHSRFLIVIASPRSARSRYVNEEVRYFRELGRGDRILVLIVDGEPNVRLHPRAGWTAGDDCFCPALVQPLNADGTVDETQLLREEPIAADVRVKDSEPPREMLAKESAQDYRRGLLDFMKLKLVAGLMGVGLDELVQRDKRRAEEQEKRARQALSRTEFLFARQLLDLAERETGTARLEFRAKAFARLAKSRRSDPDNSAATVVGLEQVRRFVNRGALRVFAGTGAVFSPCGSFVLTWRVNEARLWDAATGAPLAGPLYHESPVISAVFSPEGGRILTVSSKGTAQVWDVASCEIVSTLPHQENPIINAAFNPDGGRILTVSLDGTICLWEADTAIQIAIDFSNEGLVKSTAFSPDGGRILTTAHNSSAKLWDANTGTQMAALFHDSYVTCAVFNPDGSRIITSSSDHTARVWDAASGTALACPLQHQDSVISAVFSPDGAQVLTASWDHTAKLWDVETGALRGDIIGHESSLVSAVFSNDGGRILTASDDHTVRIWNAATSNPLNEPMRHEDWVVSAVFSPDGGRILTTTCNNSVRLWDATTASTLAEPCRHERSVFSAVFSPEGGRILTASEDNTAQIWDATNSMPLTEPFRHGGEVSTAFFGPEGSRILTASHDGTARLWDSNTGAALIEPIRHSGRVRSAVFSPDGGRILTVSGNTAQLWNAATGEPIAEPLRHLSEVNSAKFSLKGDRVITASADGTARIWDAFTGVVLAESLKHSSHVNSAVFSPEGDRVLTASHDSTARLWDSYNGTPLAEPLRHNAWVHFAIFSPEGARVLTASADRSAQLWDAATGTPTIDRLNHKDGVNFLAFSRDGRRILTSSEDNTARLWDANSGASLAEPFRHEGRVRSAVFNPEGEQILTASDDKTVRLWDGATGELLTESSGYLNCLLEIVGGRRLNDRELLESIPLEEIAALRAAFDSASDLDRLLRWWWSDPFTRPIHASSAITVPEFVRRRIGEVLDWEDDEVKVNALREARDAFPHHPLVRLCDALVEPGTAPDPAWLRHHALTRLLAEPHYLVLLEPPNALGDAKANRQYELTHGLAMDCFLGARLLLNDRAGVARTTDPEQIAQARQLLARARKLWPENEAIARLAAEIV